MKCAIYTRVSTDNQAEKEYNSCEAQEERIKSKPGCIPPYVALCMPDDKGNIEAERIYLRDKKRNPYFTDIRYFFKAVYNIVTNKIRSS